MTAVDERDLQQREESAFGRRQRRTALVIGSGRVLLLIGLLVVWFWASGRLIDRLFVSDPLSVVRQLWKMANEGQLAYHIRFTLLEVSAGYAIGALLGLLFAWLLSLGTTFEKIVRPFFIAFYGIPKIALAPLIVMWFGLGVTPKIFIAAVFVFFVVSLNTLAGIQAVSHDLINIARVMGANRFDVMTKIVFPSSLPYIMTALRITIPQAMVGAIIGEFLAGNRGVGYLINSASNQYNTAGAFAAIAALLLIVLVMDWLVSLAERRFLRWRVG